MELFIVSKIVRILLGEGEKRRHTSALQKKALQNLLSGKKNKLGVV